MGRHSSTTGKPLQPKQTPFHKAWRLLPRDFRARVWRRRQQWRAWWDRFYSRPRLRDWDKVREWEDSLPRDPGLWSDAWDHIGSYAVAAELRRRHAERGDLLPQRPRIEPL
jgi:hypothetical protein